MKTKTITKVFAAVALVLFLLANTTDIIGLNESWLGQGATKSVSSALLSGMWVSIIVGAAIVGGIMIYDHTERLKDERNPCRGPLGCRVHMSDEDYNNAELKEWECPKCKALYKKIPTFEMVRVGLNEMRERERIALEKKRAEQKEKIAKEKESQRYFSTADDIFAIKEPSADIVYVARNTQDKYVADIENGGFKKLAA